MRYNGAGNNEPEAPVDDFSRKGVAVNPSDKETQMEFESHVPVVMLNSTGKHQHSMAHSTQNSTVRYGTNWKP